MTVDFDESLFTRPTPWAACAALEAFFGAGGHCKLSDKINWRGLVFTSGNRVVSDFDGKIPEMAEALAWARMTILIYESLATDCSPGDAPIINEGAMRARVEMINRCGHHEGDLVCDLDRVIDWCLNLTAVQKALLLREIPPIWLIDSEVRIVIDMVRSLHGSGRLQRAGGIDSLLSFADKAGL